MRYLILFASSDGQTRKISGFAADLLRAAGHQVDLHEAGTGPIPDPRGYDGAILAASLHYGRYQKPLVAAARAHAAALNAMKTLFLSVSLSAAGDNPTDWAGLRKVVADLQQSTGWTPGRIEHVAGALKLRRYGFFTGLVMRWIAKRRDRGFDRRGDTEYTDWDALGAALQDWAGA